MVILNLPFPGRGIVSATLAEGQQGRGVGLAASLKLLIMISIGKGLVMRVSGYLQWLKFV